MANTYTQLYIQTVFVVQYRNAVLDSNWRSAAFEYMAGIIRSMDHKVIIVNGVEDHVHAFFGLNPNVSISETMKQVKGRCSSWINENNLCNSNFRWQEGYAAFSYRKRDIDQIYNYILNQEAHHRATTFEDEYKSLLKEFDIDYDERYILKSPV
jgi:putative transposase